MKAYSGDHLISGGNSYGFALHDEEDGDSSLFSRGASRQGQTHNALTDEDWFVPNLLPYTV